MSVPKTRVDTLLVERGYYEDAQEALRAIIAGDVHANGCPVTSAATLVARDVELKVASRSRYVSRGGFKLEGALRAFQVDVHGLDCLDCGTSTGGFTDCLLQHGAKHVCAVDVGYGQFAWSLRCNPAVTLMERTNIRDLQVGECGDPFSLAVADISFAPIHSFLPHIVELLSPQGRFISLVKPQFEVARSQVGPRGVVSSPELHREVIERAVNGFNEAGLPVQGLCFSPIKGPMGNIEYLLMGQRGQQPLAVDVAGVVEASHESLD